jgi:hypothetical protein
MQTTNTRDLCTNRLLNCVTSLEYVHSMCCKKFRLLVRYVTTRFNLTGNSRTEWKIVVGWRTRTDNSPSSKESYAVFESSDNVSRKANRTKLYNGAIANFELRKILMIRTIFLKLNTMQRASSSDLIRSPVQNFLEALEQPSSLLKSALVYASEPRVSARKIEYPKNEAPLRLQCISYICFQ